MKSLIATGSIQNVAESQNKPLADAFLDIQLVILADRSYSMETPDAEERQPRFKVEDRIVANLQAQYPGKILLASFDSDARLHPEGYLKSIGGSTYMMTGLKLIAPFCVGDVRAFVISDGEPMEDTETLCSFVRLHFLNRLDVGYAGPKNSEGYRVMEAIARAARGKIGDNVLLHSKLLESQIGQLLIAANRSANV